MEIKRLRQFRSIVEAGGLTRAADLLRVAPGTLSKSIRQLEREVGQALFMRVRRSLELTDAGRTLYAASDRLLQEYSSLLERFDPNPEVRSGSLRIASFEPFTTHTLGAVAAEGFPSAELRVLDLAIGDIEQAVADRVADAGVTYAPVPDRDLSFEKIARIEFAPFVRRGAFKNTSFEETPFAIPVAPVSVGPMAELTIDSWPNHVPRNVRYRLTTMESALELCRRGLCAVFLPTFLAGLHNETVRPPLRLRRIDAPRALKPVRQTVYLVTRIAEPENDLVLRLGQVLGDTIGRGEKGLETRAG